MNDNDALIIQLEDLIAELEEEIRTSCNMVTAAYKNGKRDAYSMVLCALRESEGKECKSE